MRDLEISVDGELFVVTERLQPGGAPSYDFDWRNGPAAGKYGFTAAFGAAVSRERLVEEARLFVTEFFSPGGIGPEDFGEPSPKAAGE